MGPVGGGKLAGVPKPIQEKLGISVTYNAELPLKFVLSNPNVDIVLSGMSTREMIDENVAVASSGEALTEKELRELRRLIEENEKLAELYCTACNYCMPCPHGVRIPQRFQLMNYYRVFGLEDYALREYEKLREKEAASEGEGICIECGQCMSKCPQNIDIINQLKETENILTKKT